MWKNVVGILANKQEHFRLLKTVDLLNRIEYTKVVCWGTEEPE